MNSLLLFQTGQRERERGVCVCIYTKERCEFNPSKQIKDEEVLSNNISQNNTCYYNPPHF